MPLGAVHAFSTSVEDREGTVDSSAASTTSGGASRRTFAPDVRQTRPASSAASTTGCAGAVELGADEQAGAAHLDDVRQRRRARRAAARRSRAPARAARRRSRRTTASAAAHDDGVAAERRAVVAGRERARRVVGDEQAADRQAVREALRERDELRPHAELLEGEERAGAADAGLHLVEGEQRAELVRERGRGRSELRRRAG